MKYYYMFTFEILAALSAWNFCIGGTLSIVAGTFCGASAIIQLIFFIKSFNK